MRLHQKTLENGLTLLCEPMPAVRSAAYTFLVPGGSIYDRRATLGSAAVMAEWITRGAGSRGGPELLAAFDELGVTHGEGAQAEHLALSGVTIGQLLLPALELVGDMLQRPRLEESEIDPIRALLIQSLRGIEDDPASKIAVELRRVHFPDPWGRPTQGTPETLEAVVADRLREHFFQAVRPNGSILAVAGAVEWDRLVAQVEAHFGGWKSRQPLALDLDANRPQCRHITKETQQIQISDAIRSVPVGHADYYAARAAAAILGGYSSSRLFTEVREKRGLCYSIHAGYDCVPQHAAIICQAGTAPDRAQETLDVMLAELGRLKRSGVVAEELDTMRAGLKSSLVMQQESSSTRAAALAGDWYYLGRVRSVAEISAALDALTAERVSEYCAQLPLDEMTLLTLGASELTRVA